MDSPQFISSSPGRGGSQENPEGNLIMNFLEIRQKTLTDYSECRG